MQQRGYDPDMLTPLGTDVSLSPGEMESMVPGAEQRLRRMQDQLKRLADMAEMPQLAFGATPDPMGEVAKAYTGATPQERSAATSLVGEDYLRHQELLKEYSPEQIEIWRDVARRTDKIMLESGLEGPHLVNGKMLKDVHWDEAQEEAVQQAIKSLSWDEVKTISPSKGLFGDLLGNFGKFMSWMEHGAGPLIGGPLARTADEGFPFLDPEGHTAFERGAELSRPVAQDLLEGTAMRFEMMEEGFEEVTGIHTRIVSDATRSQVAEDILTEVINPAALVLVAPIVMQGTAGLRGGALANKMASNLLGTGMEPELVGGTARGLTAIWRGGLGVLQTVPRNVRNTRVFQAALHGEATVPKMARATDEVVTSFRGAEKGGMEMGLFGTEGSGLYVTGDRALAESFGDVQEIQHIAPRNPLIVKNEPLYILREDPRVYEVVSSTDSLWARLNKEAVKEGKLTAEIVAQKGTHSPFGMEAWPRAMRRTSRILAQKIRAAGYDAVRVLDVDGAWEVLLDPSLTRDILAPNLLRRAEELFTSSKKAVAEALQETNAYRAGVKDGRLSQEALDQSLMALGQRRKEFTKARKALNTARITSEHDEVVASLRSAGVNDETSGLIGRAFEQSAKKVVAEEVLLNAKWWRQWPAAVVGVITGTPPGVVGRLANRREILLGALRRYTAETTNPIFSDVQKMLNKELPHITYIGETKWASEAMGTYKAYHVIQHPEWYDGLSYALKKRMGDAQEAMRIRLEAAKAMGYPIKALDGAYLEQLWEIPQSHLTVGDVPLPGRVSVAKPRLFDDYMRGINQGFVPKEMTVEELMQHSSGLLDQAISDAWMRQEVLRRFGKVGGKTRPGTAAFRHVLYKGWSGPEDIVNWVSKIDAPVGSNIRGIGNLSAAFRGTVFGLADIAVTGVQWPLSIAHGGFQVGLGTLTRSLELAGIDLFHVYAKDATFMGRLVDGAEHGLHVGIGPSSITLKGGTVVKYAPKVGKTIDKPISKAIDVLAQAQFGHALTFVRLRMYEGNLILLKMVGKNIDDPAVRRMAAEWANSCTGASRGAMTRGRRALESISLTSVQMTRANLSVYGQLISQLSPKAGRMERLRAAVTLANLGAYTYGIQYLFNSAFGDGPQEWIPGRSDWATIRIGGTTVPIMPQRSILRAMDKSIRIIEDYAKEEPDTSLSDIAKAWSQVAVGKGSPLVGAPLAGLFGIGFEPETGQFHVGDLSLKGRAMGIAPVPPLVEQIAFQERDVLSLTTAGLGFNPYDTLSGKLLREQFSSVTKEELNWESPAHSALIEDTPALSKLWEKSKEESREYGSQSAITSFEIKQEIEQGEQDKGIVVLAEAVKSGDPMATQRWSDARGSFLGWRDGKWDERFTARDPKTEIGVLVQELYAINPKSPEFTTSSGVTDWSAFNDARDAVKAKMSQADRKAIEDKEKFINPVAEAIDKEFRAAQDSLRPLWDLEDGVWERLQGKYPDFQQYPNIQGFKDAKVQELINNGVPQEDIAWRLERLPIISKIGELVQTIRFQYRMQHPDVDALWVKWYGGTPARQQAQARGSSTTRGRFGQRRSR